MANQSHVNLKYAASRKKQQFFFPLTQHSGKRQQKVSQDKPNFGVYYIYFIDGTKGSSLPVLLARFTFLIPSRLRTYWVCVFLFLSVSLPLPLTA